MRSEQIESLQEALGYRFKNVQLLKRALIHASTGGDDNEQLEFLGDAVLGYLVTAALVDQLDGKPLGELSELKSNLVNNSHLCQVAVKLGIDRALIMGPSEQTHIDRSTKVCADAVEATIGAICEDGGIEAARQFVDNHVLEGQLLNRLSIRHPKSLLQEWTAARGHDLPHYEVIEYIAGSPTETWRVRCSISDIGKSSIGLGVSKRQAEREAALELYARVQPS